MKDEGKKPETEKPVETPEENAKPASDAAAKPAEPAPDAKAAEKPSSEKPIQEPQPEEKPVETPPPTPDWKGMYARMLADFDNFRKRTARDREDLVKGAAADVLKDILTTVDDLARALEHARDKAEDPFVQGVQKVYDGLVKTLADHGAAPLDTLNEPFDANFHEALATLPSPDVPEGHVMNEVKRGWLLHGKLLRAAQVVVSAGKGA